MDEATAEQLANTNLPEGYGSLSAKALAQIIPALRAEVITYDKAVKAAGFEHHSNISHASTGEILPLLPYYGEYLQRHVGFGTGKPEDPPVGQRQRVTCGIVSHSNQRCSLTPQLSSMFERRAPKD